MVIPWKVAIDANTKIFLFLYTQYCFRVSSSFGRHTSTEIFFLVIVSSLHLDELKSGMLSRLQHSRLVSDCCTFSQSAIDLMGLYTLVSSAYRDAVFAFGKMSGRSLIKIKKRIGPSMLPCGTPDVTGAQCDEAQSITTL